MSPRDERILNWFSIAALVAAAFVLPALIVDESTVSGTWRDVAGGLDWAIWGVFAAEIVVAVVLLENRWEWLKKHPIEIAIVVLTPPFLPASLQAIRALRLLRLLRLIGVAKLAKHTFSLRGLRAAAFIALLVAVGGGAAFAAAEHRHLSAWDGIYWSMMTMTTVGYGDISPHTTMGRVIAVCVVIVGLGFIAVLTAALADRFVEHRALARAEGDLLAQIEIAEHELVIEIRDVMQRLGQLEKMVRRLAEQSQRPPPID